MKRNVSLEELSQISYFEIKRIDNRIITLQPCFNDQKEWEMWLPGPDGLTRMKNMEPVESHYFAKEPVSNADGHLEFSEWMLKRAYYPEVAHFIEDIMDDLHNLGASAEKLDLFFEDWQREHSKVTRRYVSTELEYVFNVCRSMYDLLQKIICRLWNRVKLKDEKQEKRKKNLRESFARMVLAGNKLLTKKAIGEKYLLPPPLSEFYFRQGGFFQWLKDYRDHILHHGQSFQHIYLAERGFAVLLEDEPFASLEIWNENNTLPNYLGSVRSAMAHVITSTILALEEFTRAVRATIEFPYDIAPNYHVFIRGRHTETLLRLEKYINDEAWPLSDDESTN